ncbi:MAG: type 1 glutamine amidotransferase [Thermoleophilia bacterium]
MKAPTERPRVVVLQHVECEPLGTLQPIFEQAFDTVVLEAFSDPVVYHHAVQALLKEHAAGGPMAFDGLVALGGPMSVYDHVQVEGLDDSLGLLRAAVHADTPILGICLGAQLLAWTLGAQVRPGYVTGRRKEIGWFPVDLTERGRVDPAFHGFDARRPVFHWHGDTFDLPEDARLLASSRMYPNQAFRWGRWAYGIQFHVEVTPALVEEWTRRYADELATLDYVDAAAVAAEAPVHAPGLQAGARALGDRFVECVRESMRERSEGSGLDRRLDRRLDPGLDPGSGRGAAR